MSFVFVSPSVSILQDHGFSWFCFCKQCTKKPSLKLISVTGLLVALVGYISYCCVFICFTGCDGHSPPRSRKKVFYLVTFVNGRIIWNLEASKINIVLQNILNLNNSFRKFQSVRIRCSALISLTWHHHKPCLWHACRADTEAEGQWTSSSH